MAITVDKSGTGATSASIAAPSVDGCILVAITMGKNNSGSPPVATVSGGTGLTWQRHFAQSGTFSVGTVRTGFEIWWAYQTTKAAVTASVSFTNSPNETGVWLGAFAGNFSTTNPWTSAVGASGWPTYNFGNSGAIPDLSGPAVTEASSMAMFMAYCSNGTIGIGTGWTAQTAPISNRMVVGTQVGTQNVAPNCKVTGSSTQTWVEEAAVLVEQVNSNTGTISMALTKASINANGWHTVKGTIATNLTKASQSLAGKSQFQGSITTRLSGISQIAHDIETFTGTITTRLTKPSQTINGALSFTGSITTMLKGFSQALNARTGNGFITQNLAGIRMSATGEMKITGTITTTLRKANLSLAAQEIFTGTMTTALRSTGFGMEALTFEVFTGTIVTRLGPANFSLAGLEEMQGVINTRLGGANGQTIGNVVEALVIIQGPIEMHLDPFKVYGLGAQLGTPGEGDWQTWRYTDS